MNRSVHEPRYWCTVLLLLPGKQIVNMICLNSFHPKGMHTLSSKNDQHCNPAVFKEGLQWQPTDELSVTAFVSPLECAIFCTSIFMFNWLIMAGAPTPDREALGDRKKLAQPSKHETKSTHKVTINPSNFSCNMNMKFSTRSKFQYIVL